MPLIASALLAILSPSSALTDEVLVAVASNFIKPMQAISERFTEQTGHVVKLSFGSSGKLMTQIRYGAPYELFLSADKDKVVRLLDAGLAVKGSEFIYAQGRLVLWSKQQGLVDGTGEVLKSERYKHIALADAKLAPYGKAAEQVIDRLNLNEHILPRIVKGENISQTYQFVRTGNAELGFIALSQIKQLPNAQQGSGWLIPQDHHHTIEQYAVLLNRGSSNPAAIALQQFMTQSTTLALIRTFGYDTADHTAETSASPIEHTGSSESATIYAERR